MCSPKQCFAALKQSLAQPAHIELLSCDEIATVALPFLCYPLQKSMTMRGNDIIEFGKAILEAAMKKQQPKSKPLPVDPDVALENAYE